jgi:streptogramin lyase
LILALLGGCSALEIGSGSGTGWECTPINPVSKALPDNPCFRAVLSSDNEITLQWRVEDSDPLIYIYDDFGVGFKDVGFKEAICPSKPESICSTSITVTQGGFHRWLLRADDSQGNRVHVPASITVPSPYPPVEVIGGGFVDMLAPTSRRVSWLADERNAPLEQTTEYAWVEKYRPGEWLFQKKEHLPRSGPAASFTVPGPTFSKPSRPAYSIRDCRIIDQTGAKFCSQAIVIGFFAGGDHFLDPSPLYADAGRDLSIAFTKQSGDVRRLFSSTLLPRDNEQGFLETEESSIAINANLLTPGVHTIEMMSCLRETGACSPATKLQILVGSMLNWTLGRVYTKDFLPGVAHPVRGSGEPLDITYDSEGGIWSINEFSNNIEYVSPSGTVESFTVPTARQPLKKDSAFVAAKPFATRLGGTGDKPVGFAELAERATRVGSKVWFTQGGGMRGPKTEVKNHSRVISYDPSLSQSPATPYDDRLCVYNMPTDDANNFGNNQIIGLAATADRIWIGESRGVFGERPSAISSLIPDPDSCENLLNFEDPQALANQRLQYCEPGKTPEQDGCVERFLLDGSLSTVKVAHLETDPIDNSLWFTDAAGGYLGNLNPNRDNIIEVTPLPDAHEDFSILGGFPWTLRVDDDAVYFNEYGTRHILRFDKATRTFEEIRVPITSSQGGLHSIDIDSSSDRLWFTLSNEARVTLDKAASTIGYIDLASWREHAADPTHKKTINGVIYKGLDSIGASGTRPVRHQAFRGISVDPGSGKIALATMWRKQVTELTPKAGFRPPEKAE